ncbi:MAG: hypothetical protein Q6K08_03015, partial [Thermostichales cyanobacterium GMQP_bins_62]
KNVTVSHSIIGIRSRIESNVVIENSMLMGADYYESAAEREAALAQGIPPVGIGENSHISRAIIDKNARVGRNVKIINKDHVQEAERVEQGFCIKDGIVVVLKDGQIPNDTII